MLKQLLCIILVFPTQRGNSQEYGFPDNPKIGDVFICVPGLKNREVKKSDLYTQGGVIAYMKPFDYNHWEPVSMKSYNFMIIRDTSVIFSTVNDDKRFSNAIISSIQTLTKGDIVLIFNVTVKFPDGQLKHPRAIEYKIVE